MFDRFERRGRRSIDAANQNQMVFWTDQDRDGIHPRMMGCEGVEETNSVSLTQTNTLPP